MTRRADPSVKPPRASRLRKDLLRILMVAAFFVAAALALNSGWVQFDEIREGLQRRETPLLMLKSLGIFVLLGSLLVAVGVPRIWVAAAGGAIYGAAQGAAVAMVAAMIGSLGTYQLGKTLLGSMIERRLGGRAAKWKEGLRRDAFWWVLMARLAPLMNGTAMNLALGMMRCPVKPFVSASLIGFLPLTISFALFGSGAGKGQWGQIALGCALLLGANGAWWLRRKHERRRKALEARGEPSPLTEDAAAPDSPAH